MVLVNFLTKEYQLELNEALTRLYGHNYYSCDIDIKKLKLRLFVKEQNGLYRFGFRPLNGPLCFSVESEKFNTIDEAIDSCKEDIARFKEHLN